MSIKVRRARSDDLPAIKALNRRAHRVLPQLWWWEEHLTDVSAQYPGVGAGLAPAYKGDRKGSPLPIERILTDDLFILIEQEGSVVGALFAWPDESPVAWVRLAALDDALDVDEWLDLALPPVLDGLRRHGARKLAWMDYGGWAGPHLKARGFAPLVEVITLVKLDRALPRANATPAHVRPASDADIPAIVAVDRAAFTAHWWHSQATMCRRAATSSHFAVAQMAGEVVGYAAGKLCLPAAHLNRIAVQPAHQGHGIGTSLLCAAIRDLWQQGAERITLNTQSDNRRSRRLYNRFGFEPTGDCVTVWKLQL